MTKFSQVVLWASVANLAATPIVAIVARAASNSQEFGVWALVYMGFFGQCLHPLMLESILTAE